jgi:RNA polymerase sigma-70 factor (ECF subfamily)
MMDPSNPADLLVAVGAQRDRAAMAELYRQFAPRLRAFFASTGADSAQGDELVQDVMLTLWRLAGSYDPQRASPSTWIFTIARNRRIDRVRRERAFVHDAEATETLVDPQALAALPPEQAEILHHTYVHDLSLRAFAESQNLPLGTVKSRVRLAMTALRRALQVEEPGT